MLLIGSHALIFNGIDIGRRPRDIDVIATFSELRELTENLRRETRVSSIPFADNKTALRCDDGRIIEVEIAWTDSTAADLLSLSQDLLQGRISAAQNDFGLPFTVSVPNLGVLYALKMSHRYLKNSPHFRKTRDDIMLMRRAQAQIFDDAWYKRRVRETYWYKHPKLNTTKGDFFKGDGVPYVYDHDDIHKAVAHMAVANQTVPAYTLYMKDGAQVDCDREKFFAAHEDVRLYGVLEEAQVLALERSQIPFRGKVEPRRSFDIALQKVCTSITSGWFREFAWENFDRVEAMYEPDYTDRFWRAVDAGLVKDFDPGKATTY
jgi:hypothetical protein